MESVDQPKDCLPLRASAQGAYTFQSGKVIELFLAPIDRSLSCVFLVLSP